MAKKSSFGAEIFTIAKREIMQKVIQEFLDNGFSQEEVFKIIKTRRTKNAFVKIDISNLIQKYISFFKKYQKSEADAIKKLKKVPRLFSYTPEFIERNFLSVCSFFEISPEQCFKQIWNFPVLFTVPIASIKKQIKQQADILKLTVDEWKKKAIKKPAVIKKRPDLLAKSLDTYVEELGVTKEEWIDISLKAIELFSADPNTIIAKIRSIAGIFYTDTRFLINSFSKFPSLMYADPKLMQQKYDYLKKMYEDDLIKVDDAGIKHEAYLQEYLLKKPFILVYSLEALKLKRLYAKYIKIKTGKAQKMALYKTERAIMDELKNVPDSFWTKEQLELLKVRYNYANSR